MFLQLLRRVTMASRTKMKQTSIAVALVQRVITQGIASQTKIVLVNTATRVPSVVSDKNTNFVLLRYLTTIFPIATPSCNDSIKNQLESDVDCGGSCPGCLNGKQCTKDEDCASLSCIDMLCGT